MRQRITLLFLVVMMFAAAPLFSQERSASIKNGLREQYRPTGSREPGALHEARPVQSNGTTDVLANNNAGASGTGNFTQSETSIIAFGSNVVVAFNDAGSYNGSNNHFTGWSYSTDGGASFTDGGILPASTIGDAGDPVLARNETTGRIYLSTLGFSGAGTIQMFRSDDNGVTWAAPVNATPGGGDEDKQWHVVDNFAGPGNGNVYLISRSFGSPNGIYVFRSTDHGATFGPSGGVQIVSGKQGAFIAVGPDHAVYAFWYDGTGSSIRMRKSTDFGASFAPQVTVASGLIGGTNGDLGLTGIRQGTVSASGFRSSEFPHAAINPVSGHLYVTYNNDGPGVDKADVFIVQSTNGGATWSSPTRVNDDATTTDQWQPTIAVTPSGSTVGIFYYSRQEDAANNLIKYYGRTGNISGSTINFTPSFAVSDVASLPEFGRDNVINAVYMGDYNHVHATASAFHVVWSDQRDDLAGGAPRKDPNVYYESIPAGDPNDPNPPTGVTAYSQFSTPTTMQLNWTNPTTLVSGSPIGSFVMRIKRDGIQIAEVTPPTTTYNDGGRTTYQQYTYTLQARLTANDSLSAPVEVSWIAGGSPFPGVPTGVGIVMSGPRSTQASLSWTNPTTQKDGTPVHDLAGTRIWRNGILIDSVNAATAVYVDTPPQGFVYTYHLQSYNSLVPRRYSDPSTSVGGYIGAIPDVLVWQPADAISPSGDSLSASLTRLGISNFKVDSLFEFGSDLSQYGAIFAVVGIYSNNHVIGASDPEGPALNTYVQNGGSLYLEGGDVFNYDPEQSGYQVRPIFGLNDGADGGADVSSINGRTLLNGLTFSYTGGNNFMDELHPSSDGAGRVLWVAPLSSPVNDTMGVLHSYGSGRSVASVVEFGGLVDAGANKKDSVLARILAFFNQSSADPEIVISPSSLADTLQSNQSSSLTLTIDNTTPPPAGSLIVGLSESVAWLSVTPAADTIAAASSGSFGVNFDATGLTPGTYTTNITVTSNDPNEPSTNVGISLVVTGAPNLVTVPPSIFKTMAPNATATDTLVIKNTGAAVLNWTIADIPFAGPADIASLPQTQGDVMYPPRVGRDGWPIPLAKGEADIHVGPAITEGQGGPDSAGYQWIDSDEPGGPVFSWVDISSTGTLIDQNSAWTPTGTFSAYDEGYIQIPLPFGFHFYGTTYNSAYVSSNGMLAFQIPTANNFTNAAIPTAAGPSDNFLAAFWDDLEISGTSSIYHGTSGADFVVQFVNIRRYSGTVPNYTFQYILKPGGQVLFQYLAMGINGGVLNSHTTGIENPGGTVGLQIAFNPTTAYLHNNLAILIAKDISWLSENPISGSVNAGDSAKVALTFDATGLTEAVYTAILEIVSNDFANTPLHIPVELTVGANSVGVPIDAGWNILSNPIVTANDSVLELYPTASFNYAFAYSPSTGYSQEYRLQNGTGYWEKFPSSLTQTLTGTQLTADTIPVVAGWNLIGALFSPVDTATIASVPAGIRQSPFYGFSGGYTADPVLEPGKGYWVKSSSSGSLVLSASVNSIPASGAAVNTDEWEMFSSVTISDNSGGSQVLYLGDNTRQGAYELPPVGPEGVFDARFESQRMLETVDPRHRIDFPIAVRSTAYPVTITWNIGGGMAFSLRDGITGSLVPARTITGTGEIVVTNPSINRLILSAEPGGVPTEFSLDQNYPNPFNPSTKIEYGLASSAQVTLKVFDILGQEVVTLANALQDAGYFAVEWDGRNTSGTMVSSGVYFYRMEAVGTEAGATFRTLKKMILMK